MDLSQFMLYSCFVSRYKTLIKNPIKATLLKIALRTREITVHKHVLSKEHEGFCLLKNNFENIVLYRASIIVYHYLKNGVFKFV